MIGLSSARPPTPSDALRGSLCARVLRGYGSAMTIDPDDRAAVAEFVRQRSLAVVATSDEHGRPEAALVGIAALDAGLLIFDALLDSRKVKNLRRNRDVAVVSGLTDGVSIQLEGTATICSGDDRVKHGAEYEAQHPGSRALDEDFAVITIAVTWVRVYDATTHPAAVSERRWE